MKVTNNSTALQGVRSKGRAVYIHRGQTRDIDLGGVELEKAKRLSFLQIEGASKANQDGDPKTALEVLEMAKDPNVQFMSFKSAAAKLLGEKTPAKKDEIIAALEELATQP
ncbi:hypothetical protein [Ensifer aridi]|uniref:hypothetical protein n=1 Tax=Ensifer aridi TaxID=1708715 RepID=UPI000A10523D|nr:hypothetical protein [Ensifer aridi]